MPQRNPLLAAKAYDADWPRCRIETLAAVPVWLRPYESMTQELQDLKQPLAAGA